MKVTIDGKLSEPCKVDPRKIMLSRSTDADTGYPAIPLDGTWAKAPYLHNGSVPSLYHLLGKSGSKSMRPKVFGVGSIDYDYDHLGWKYDDAGSGQFRYVTSLDGFSNAGHEGLSKDGLWKDAASGEQFKLSWDIKNPEEKEQLFNLLEYLKTL